MAETPHRPPQRPPAASEAEKRGDAFDSFLGWYDAYDWDGLKDGNPYFECWTAATKAERERCEAKLVDMTYFTTIDERCKALLDGADAIRALPRSSE